MPVCGFNPKMIQGIVLFSQGLCESVVKRAREQNVDISIAIEREIKEMSVFLAALDEKYYTDIGGGKTVEQAVKDLVAWSEQHGM
jgi:hypothetical protein